jgi:hypothetical protein
VRSLASNAVVMLGATGILVGTFYLNTLYLQNVLGYSALKTGLSFLPLGSLSSLPLTSPHACYRTLGRASSR